MQIAYELGTKLKRSICEHLHWNNPLLLLYMDVCIDTTPLFGCIHSLIDPPPSPKCKRNNWIPPIFIKDTQHLNFIKGNRIWKLIYKVKYIGQINGGLSMFIKNSRIRFFKNYLVWLWTIGKNQYFNVKDPLIILMTFIFLSCLEKTYDNEKRTRENSKPCESRMSLCLRLPVLLSRIQKCSFE